MTQSDSGRNFKVTAQTHLLGSLVAIALASVVIFPIAWSMFGGDGLFAAVVGLVVVALAAGLSHVVAIVFSDPKAALMRMGSGFLIRMGGPFIYCLIIILQKGQLFEASGHFLCFGFYAAVLAAEMVLLALTTNGDIALAKTHNEPLQNSDGENTAG